MERFFLFIYLFIYTEIMEALEINVTKVNLLISCILSLTQPKSVWFLKKHLPQH